MSKMQYQCFALLTKWIILCQFEFSRKQMPRQSQKSKRFVWGDACERYREEGEEWAEKAFRPQSRSNTNERREERKEVWVGKVSD